MRKFKLTRGQKRRYVLFAGISGLSLGDWMLFYLKNKWGIVPGIIGALFLIYGNKWVKW